MTRNDSVSSAAHRSSRGTTARRRAGARPASATGFKRGATVKVPFGVQMWDATVLEEIPGRVRVAIHMEGVDEPIRTSYAVDDVTILDEPPA